MGSCENREHAQINKDEFLVDCEVMHKVALNS
jgi:hypothetical protein